MAILKATATNAASLRFKVCPFTVIVDTREQAPYCFQNMSHHPQRLSLLVVKAVSQALRAGDYSIQGYQDRVAIERKSLEDLYGTLTAGRERFKTEMARLNELEFGAVVVEAGWDQIRKPTQYRDDWRSKASPESIFGTMLAWMQDRQSSGETCFPRVHWFTAGSRRMAEVITFSLLDRFWRDRQ